MRTRKIKEPIVAITKAMTESKSLEKALDMLPVDKIITTNIPISPFLLIFYSPLHLKSNFC